MKKTAKRLQLHRETVVRLTREAVPGAALVDVHFYTQQRPCYSPLCIPTEVETQCC